MTQPHPPGTCRACGQPIPEGRLKALPSATTCVACSTAGRVAGFAVITGKTSSSEIQLVSQETAQELYQKQDRKGGSIANGVQFKPAPPTKLSNFDFDEKELKG